MKAREVPGLTGSLDEIIKFGSQNIPLGELTYLSPEHYYSTAFVPLVGGVFPANTRVQLFKTAQGDQGQGSPAGVPLTISETNNENGQRQAVNEAYCATKLGISIYSTSGTNLKYVPLARAQDLNALLEGIVWTHKKGNGPVRTISNLKAWPEGGGAWYGGVAGGSATATSSAMAVGNGSPDCEKGELRPNLIFPPLQDVVIAIECGTEIDLSQAFGDYPAQFAGTEAIAIKFDFEGARLTNAGVQL